MNKTININLGGYFFHIDEDAYQKLRRYLDAIAKSLSDDPQGKNEIISDIETRISELLSEKITDARQVVNEQDISDVIKIMGEPEDYVDGATEEGYTDTSYKYTRKQSNTKKLFRDGDDKFLGGVASGIAHYFDVDVIWIRLAFLVLLLGGFGLLLYIILWILLPEARTTAEKLQMEGEPVNIDNIEKKIREELSSVTESIKDGADKITQKVNEGVKGVKKNGKKASSGFQDFLDALGKIILAFFNVIGKFIGVIIIIVSASVLISFIIALFSVGSIEVLGFEEEFLQLPSFMHDSMIPHWLLVVCALVLAGIPFLILFVLGLRILSSNVKRFSKTTSLTLLGIWLVALLIAIFTAIEFGASHARSGSSITKKELAIQPTDTLRLEVANDDSLYYQSYLRRRNNKEEVYVNDKRQWYSNYVKVDVAKSKDGSAYAEVRKRSRGRNVTRAQKVASKIKFDYEIKDNKIIVDGYFLTDYRNFARDEAVYFTLFIPEGVTVFFDESSEYFLNNVSKVEGIYDRDMIDHHFLMTEDGLDCSDCIEEKEEEIKEEENTEGTSEE